MSMMKTLFARLAEEPRLDRKMSETRSQASRTSPARAGRFTGSLRIPVIPLNKTILRDLRAAELAAWEKAGKEPAMALLDTENLQPSL
jgi:hypothetical protein